MFTSAILFCAGGVAAAPFAPWAPPPPPPPPRPPRAPRPATAAAGYTVNATHFESPLMLSDGLAGPPGPPAPPPRPPPALASPIGNFISLPSVPVDLMMTDASP